LDCYSVAFVDQAGIDVANLWFDSISYTETLNRSVDYIQTKTCKVGNLMLT